MKYIILFILLTLLFVRVVPYDIETVDFVDLKDVRALTFYKDKFTTYRRTSAIPQLTCIKGACHNSGIVEVVQCVNNGDDDNGDPQWKCTTTIDKNYKLGVTTVSCEGHRNSKDKYKLAGSCGLKYELIYEPVKKVSTTHTTHTIHHGHTYHSETTVSHIIGIIISTIFFVAFLSCLCSGAVATGVPYRRRTYYSFYVPAQTTHHSYPSSTVQHTTYTHTEENKKEETSGFGGTETR